LFDYLDKINEYNVNDVEIKYFTPQEAKMTLPLVRQIVKDILDSGFIIKSLSDALDGKIDNNDEIKALLVKMNKYLAELEEIGCYYKDWNFAVGMVDFPAIINDEEVFLCWQSDEEDIIYYHKPEDGFGGRRRIPRQYIQNL
jgi:hypothetical protein